MKITLYNTENNTEYDVKLADIVELTANNDTTTTVILGDGTEYIVDIYIEELVYKINHTPPIDGYKPISADHQLYEDEDISAHIKTALYENENGERDLNLTMFDIHLSEPQPPGTILKLTYIPDEADAE